MEEFIFPTLSTKRLILRKLEAADRREIFNLRSNQQVNQFLERKPATTLDDADAFIQMILKGIEKNDTFYWAICLKENPRPIGTVSLFDLAPDKSSVEIGFELLPFYHGNGIMHEAISTVVYYAFHTMEVTTITATCSVDNLASIKLLKRIGFEQQLINIQAENNLLTFALKR
jgi:ribosomal-protein-alanine N-acetyltransferase